MSNQRRCVGDQFPCRLLPHALQRLSTTTMAATAIRSVALIAIVLLTVSIVAGELLLDGPSLASLLTSSAATDADPLQVFGSPSVDFGEQPQKVELAHTFQLRNVSSSRVRIVEYRSSCSCMATPPQTGAKLILAPGAQLDVPVTFKTGTQQSTANGTLIVSYGNLTETDEVTNISQLALRLTARITPPYRITPDVLDFGSITDLSPAGQTKSFEIIGLGKEPLQVTDIKTSNPWVVAQLKPSDPATSRYSIDVSLNAQALTTASRQIRDAITLSLSSEVSPIAYVQVKADYRPSVECSPTSLTVSSSVGGTVKRGVRIVPACKAEVLELISTNPESIRPRIVSTNEDGSINCEVELADSAPRPLAGALQVTMRLMPDDSRTLTREVSIPVYRFSKERGHEN